MKPIKSLDTMIKHIRWYFDVGRWKPTREDWLRMTSCIPDDEMERINKFYFKDDSKSSLIGQALIRAFVFKATNIPSNRLPIERSSHGRPQVGKESVELSAASWPKLLDFNVSHSGRYCVLAGFWSGDANSPEMTVGVDVTKVVKKRTTEELRRFLALMSKREFLPAEWETVEKVSDERQKCINFTRLWCLKESFIKSIGLGLSFKLSRICFEPSEAFRFDLSTDRLRGRMLADTRVILDGSEALDWRFLETALDDEHLVAVGYNFKTVNCDTRVDESPFEELALPELLDLLTPMRDAHEPNWSEFESKEERPM